MSKRSSVMNHVELFDLVERCKKEIGVSYKKMAEKARLNETTFCKWRGGLRELPEDKVDDLAEVVEELLR